jgi:prophage regulatory protein
MRRALRLPGVIAKTGVCRSDVYDGMKNGWFPKNFKLVPDGKAVAWDEAEIEEFLDKRKAERDGKPE